MACGGVQPQRPVILDGGFLPQILVTGGTGFIGRHLVRQILESGARVRLLSRSARKAESLFGKEVEIEEGDVCDGVAVIRACRDVGRVFHLAGLYQFGARHRRELWQTNVGGTQSVLDACRRAGVERFVHCSTAGVLTAQGRLVTERDFPERPPAGGGYKHSKWQAELEVLRAAQTGFPAVIVSPTAPIGAEDERPTPTGRMLLDLMKGRFPACSRTGFNAVAVEDVVTGILAAGDRGVPGQRYLLGHVNLWLADFLAQAAVYAGVPTPRILVPWPLLAVGGVVADAWSLAVRSGGERLCWETACFARQRQFFDFTATHATLDWRPVIPLAEAIRDAVAWFAAGRSSSHRIPAAPGQPASS